MLKLKFWKLDVTVILLYDLTKRFLWDASTFWEAVTVKKVSTFRLTRHNKLNDYLNYSFMYFQTPCKLPAQKSTLFYYKVKVCFMWCMWVVWNCFFRLIILQWVSEWLNDWLPWRCGRLRPSCLAFSSTVTSPKFCLQDYSDSGLLIYPMSS
jgi:hypothetical protein